MDTSLRNSVMYIQNSYITIASLLSGKYSNEGFDININIFL